jgi:hypothetical protein
MVFPLLKHNTLLLLYVTVVMVKYLKISLYIYMYELYLKVHETYYFKKGRLYAVLMSV